MADKKSGYEKAAEATPEVPARRPTEVATSSGAAHDIVTGDKARDPQRVSKKAPRKVSKDLRVMNQIDALLEEVSAEAALRILKYHQEKQEMRMRKEMFPPRPFTDISSAKQDRPMSTGQGDPRFLPGGIFYTPPLPGLEANG